MKIREWSQRLLWFVLGVVTTGAFMAATTSYGKRAEVGLPVPTLEQRVTTLEQKVKGLEDRHDREDKAAEKASRH